MWQGKCLCYCMEMVLPPARLQEFSYLFCTFPSCSRLILAHFTFINILKGLRGYKMVYDSGKHGARNAGISVYHKKIPSSLFIISKLSAKYSTHMASIAMDE
mmetsp:Transcript_6991/g.10217  ORF Transcript_6991/g.10217 Transcript_6991/m.10217 type:complete len:102 (-) Transcript_6991:225-530(-)